MEENLNVGAWRPMKQDEETAIGYMIADGLREEPNRTLREENICIFATLKIVLKMVTSAQREGTQAVGPGARLDAIRGKCYCWCLYRPGTSHCDAQHAQRTCVRSNAVD